MGRHYTQLSTEDRCELACLYAQGCSLRQIATTLDRAPATIARELKRNTSRQQGYQPRYAQEQARAWRHFLPRAKWRRGRRGRRGGSAATRIPLRRPLAERPATATDHQPPGHWEADLMLFRTSGQAVLTMHERHSRLLLAGAKMPAGACAAGCPARPTW